MESSHHEAASLSVEELRDPEILVRTRGLTMAVTGRYHGIDTTGDGLVDAWDTTGDGLVDAWDTTGDGRIDALDTTGDGLVDAWDTTGDRQLNAWDTTGDGRIDALDTTGDGRIDAWDTTGDGMIDALDTTGDGLADTRLPDPKDPQEIYDLFGMSQDGSPKPSPDHHPGPGGLGSRLVRVFAMMIITVTAVAIVFGVLTSNTSSNAGRTGWMTAAGSAAGIRPFAGQRDTIGSKYEFGCVDLPPASGVSKDTPVAPPASSMTAVAQWNRTRSLKQWTPGSFPGEFGWIEPTVAAPRMKQAEADNCSCDPKLSSFLHLQFEKHC